MSSKSKAFRSLFFFFCILKVCSATYQAYVSSTGTSNLFCTLESPCGTLFTVLENINSGNIASDDNAYEITVDSVNIGISYCADGYVDPLEINGDVTITFNADTITSTWAWFPEYGSCEPAGGCVPGTCVPFSFFYLTPDSSLTMVNLIWESHTHLLLTNDDNTAFYCKQCQFNDLSGAAFVVSSDIVFDNCLFENINGQFMSLFPKSSTKRADGSDTFVNISHCTFTNIAGSNFIDIESVAQYKKTINIEHSSVTTAANTATTFIYLSYDLSFTQQQNVLLISSSEFYGQLKLIHIESGASVAIRIDNTRITYSQYFSYDLLDSASDAQSTPTVPLYIGSTDAQTRAKNVTGYRKIYVLL